jgi:ATP-dependent Clp protease ATP-binding subunit ClpA
VFERFTEESRQAVVEAQNEAREQRHDYIGTEHLFLGLLRDANPMYVSGHGLARIVLNGMGINLPEARNEVLRIAPAGSESTSGQLMLTPHAVRALDMSQRETLSLGTQHIGTEHVLMALIRDSEDSVYPREEIGMRSDNHANRVFPDDEKPIVGEVLETLDVNPEEVTSSVRRILQGDQDLLQELRR